MSSSKWSVRELILNWSVEKRMSVSEKAYANNKIQKKIFFYLISRHWDNK